MASPTPQPPRPRQSTESPYARYLGLAVVGLPSGLWIAVWLFRSTEPPAVWFFVLTSLASWALVLYGVFIWGERLYKNVARRDPSEIVSIGIAGVLAAVLILGGFFALLVSSVDPN